MYIGIPCAVPGFGADEKTLVIPQAALIRNAPSRVHLQQRMHSRHDRSSPCNPRFKKLQIHQALIGVLLARGTDA